MMLEQSLITHSAPTLAGLKTGSLFCFSYSSGAELEAQLSRCRLALQDKGVRIRILRRTPDRALLYVYRPAKLAQDLQKPGVPEFLAQMGYPSLNPEQALGRLAQKTARQSCHHEVGLFLGYPLADVVGFIENEGKNCKCAGCWKVYGNEAAARRRFAQFKACRYIYAYQFQNGRTLSQLTVPGPAPS